MSKSFKNLNPFNTIKVERQKTNRFDLTHDIKMSGKIGNLMPCMLMDCIPGDSIDLNASSLVRFAPMTAPVMHKFNQTIHYFFVPNRLVWDGWEKFIANEPREGESTPPLHPTVLISDTTPDEVKKLMDYLGFPPPPETVTPAQAISALPFAAYNLIFNEYYRDQDLETPLFYKLSDGDNSAGGAWTDVWAQVRNRAYMHDYFTSARPWAQKGNPVGLPLGDMQVKINSSQSTQLTGTPVNAQVQGEITPDVSGDNLYADGTTSTTTIADLRRAFKLQEWLEKNARGGTRYIELILSHFGIKSSDKRLQRPEYITGIKSPIVISEVLSQTDFGVPLGEMAGHGISVQGGNAGHYFCEEYGQIIGIMSVTPIPAYMTAAHKSWFKRDYLDYFWPSFAHVGEQAIEHREIYPYDPNPLQEFGYTQRYAEYKYQPSRVAGEFRNSLNYWHAAREFTSAPALNADFIRVDPVDCDRIFAVQTPDVDKIYMHIVNSVQANRPIPFFSNPLEL